jgi:hypothetical protein
MTYEIICEQLNQYVTLAKIYIDGTLYGQQEVCSTDEAIVKKQIEDYYLVDERRKPYSTISSLHLPIDDVVISIEPPVEPDGVV